MVTDSLALFRSNRSKDLHKLAKEQLEHDLQPKDRDILRRAGRKMSTHVGLGSSVGIGLGLYGAYKLRNMRLAYFNAFEVQWKNPLNSASPTATQHPRGGATQQHSPSLASEA
ncbi:hypothetical protein B5807_00913 [Epicoccum nigrum]|uniref:Uncharacterized protein n=1 Tax=Epicoccum nigrum TaxID=105696 RepID=A0A1Y2MFG8_EPING|nr:hypothetical protein B5807_00913 [Epicoccum nigrum]